MPHRNCHYWQLGDRVTDSAGCPGTVVEQGKSKYAGQYRVRWDPQANATNRRPDTWVRFDRLTKIP